MTQIEESVLVDVPLAVAYEQWRKVEDFPRFMRGVVSIERRGGELTHWVVGVAGAHREFDAATTEVVPDERVAWAAVAGEVRQSGVVTFHRLGEDCTRIMLQLEVEPQGLLERIGEALGFVDRQVIDDLHDFKEFVEAAHGGPPSAPPGADPGTPRAA
ncbi:MULTISPECIES: SRPBCC family protein [unclassified Kitasatospora]|uniref:SRPBCC family protein n=1 Tax=unclassified Kitasatospora TaxID=2633591 RepID=UPI002E3797F1|nr:SRPBCC family protein [Kitasatospora sp. NBC_01246]